MGSAKPWSYKAGEKGRNRVRAFERDSGIIYLEFWEAGERERVSTGHRNREKAKQQADELAARFAEESPEEEEDLRLGPLFNKYLRIRTPQVSEQQQKFHRRIAELFCRYFGRDRRVEEINRQDWDQFQRARRSGEIDASGLKVSDGEREGRGARIVAKDLKGLNAVCNWGVQADLLDHNPVQGYPYPREESPNRPVLSEERFQAMLEVAGEVDWRFRLALVLADETGHRIGSIRRLRWSDLDLEEGVARWRGSEDKMANEHLTALSEPAVEALKRAQSEQAAIGEAWVFPAPGDASEPCSRHLMRDWWLRAEELADLDHVEGMGWHALRRRFASEFKHIPLKDLAGLGGWQDERTILECYQATDLDAQREALKRRVGR